MKFYKLPLLTFVLLGAVAHAAAVTGTVTNQTDGKPSAGDTVVLVDVQAGMTDAATATTDVRGHFSLEAPGMGTYLIRVTHQGGSYFIAAPQNGSPANINVYDVSAKLDGVAIDADMLLLEAAGRMLRVQERYLVRNTSLPPRAQFSANTFEIVIPPDALLDGAAATRPGGIATNTHLVPLAQKGHYTFNVPIQPDQGQKETLFEVQYHINYSGKYTLTPHLQMPADNLVVYAAKGMTFSEPQGAAFQATQEDPRVQTFVAKSIRPGQSVSFTISGEGQMSRDTQGGGTGTAMQSTGASGGTANGLDSSNQPSDWFTKYKWWIVAPLLLLLASAAAFWLRKRKEAAPLSAATNSPANVPPAKAETLPQFAPRVAPAVTSNPLIRDNTVLLGLLKEELFTVEREKLSGTLSPSEYADIKRGLDAMLKRVLKQPS